MSSSLAPVAMELHYPAFLDRATNEFCLWLTELFEEKKNMILQCRAPDLGSAV